jgi:hypothetical protein
MMVSALYALEAFLGVVMYTATSARSTRARTTFQWFLKIFR